MEPQASENLVDLLGELQDIVEPPPVSLLPQTWAWAVLAALAFVALGFGLWAFLRYRRATAWRRAALAELRALTPALEAGDPGALAGLETLLRRVALVAFPRAEVARLTGGSWARFLAETGGGFGPLAAALAAAPYRPASGYDGTAAVAAARRWIRRQHA
jgi:hypothetical protein